jgi:hypothetical protein
MPDFGPELFEWWAGLTPVVRYGIGIVFIVLGAAVCFISHWNTLGISLLAAGIVLLLFAGRTAGE